MFYKANKVLILFLLFANGAFSQTRNIKAFIGCYGDKDTLSLAYLNNQSGINVLSTLANEDFVVSSYEMVLFSKGTMNTFRFNNATFFARTIYNPCEAIKEGDKILIQNIKVQLKNTATGKNTEMKIVPATFFIGKNCSKNCKAEKRFSSIHKDYAKVELSCFGDGDIALLKDILKQPFLSIVDVDPNYKVELVSYMNYTQLGNEPFCPSCADDKLSRSFLGATNSGRGLTEVAVINIKKCDSTLPIKFIHIDNIYVEVTNKKSNQKSKQELSPITINIANEGTKSCNQIPLNSNTKSSKVNYMGKLVSGKDQNQPVANQKVELQNQNDEVIQSTMTDKYGDFKFTELSTDKTYKIEVLLAEDTKIKDGLLFIAKTDGTIVSSFKKTQKGFVYVLLPAELNILSKELEEDTELKIKNFGASADANLTVIENIYYDLNSADIKLESVAKLDKIISAMAQNKNLKLSINSHTDANGEDAFNMSLSEKRAQKVMDYFILKGIEKDRLKAKGFGETQIKNRCKNGVDCSEIEHQLNRRTEFNFTK